MILLFTDFGPGGPYVGQMRQVLARHAPGAPVIDLMHDAPPFRPRLAGALLAALGERLPAGSVTVAVVDPGVGTERPALALEIDGRWLLGPDNGLLDATALLAEEVRSYAIDPPGTPISATFHGRDLFAPAAARVLLSGRPPGPPVPWEPDPASWPLAEVVYIDGYGNAMLGIPAAALAPDTVIEAAAVQLLRAGTFGEVPIGTAFWYENANGLVEIAVNQGSAADRLGLSVGMPVVLDAGSARPAAG